MAIQAGLVGEISAAVGTVDVGVAHRVTVATRGLTIAARGIAKVITPVVIGFVTQLAVVVAGHEGAHRGDQPTVVLGEE